MGTVGLPFRLSEINPETIAVGLRTIAVGAIRFAGQMKRSASARILVL